MDHMFTLACMYAGNSTLRGASHHIRHLLGVAVQLRQALEVEVGVVNGIEHEGGEGCVGEEGC